MNNLRLIFSNLCRVRLETGRSGWVREHHKWSQFGMIPQHCLFVPSMVVILNLVNIVLKTMSRVLVRFEMFLFPLLVCLGVLFYGRISVFLRIILKRGLFLLLKLNILF